MHAQEVKDLIVKACLKMSSLQGDLGLLVQEDISNREQEDKSDDDEGMAAGRVVNILMSSLSLNS